MPREDTGGIFEERFLTRRFPAKKAARLLPVLFIAAFLASCVAPIQPQFMKDEPAIQVAAASRSWKKIVVLPFTGDPAFRRAAAEWFALQVAEHGLFEIVDPGRTEIELKKNGIAVGEKDLRTEDAMKAGRMLGADAVITGSLSGRPVRLAASLLDVGTGNVVASSVRTQDRFLWRGMNLSFELHDYAMAAAGEAAEDFAPVLYTIAGKTRTPPPKEAPPPPPWSTP